MTAPIRPIPRSPAVDLMLQDEREYSYMRSVQDKHDNAEQEKLPFPYDYHRILLDEKEFKEMQDKFTQQCNLRRFQHVINAEPKQKK